MKKIRGQNTLLVDIVISGLALSPQMHLREMKGVKLRDSG